MQITWKGSPNKDGSSFRLPIDLIVIHWFGVGTLESANTRFQNPAEKVSAHYGISGTKVWQWVKEEEVAWHAGVYSINQRSIGIEHDATTEHGLSDDSYKSSAELIAEICKRHNIPIDSDHIKGHSTYKATQCPGTIDLKKLISMANDFAGSTQDPCEDIREQRNKCKAESLEKSERISELEGDLNNRTEQVERLKKDIASAESTIKDLTIKLLDGDKEAEALAKVWTQRINDKQAQIDSIAAEKGALLIEISKLEAELSAANTFPRAITWAEVFGKLLNTILFWQNHGRHA